MINTVKRITTLLLAFLFATSLLTSCGSEKEQATTEVEGTPVLEVDGVPVSKVDGVPIFHQYKGCKVDLGLSETETFYDIIEIDGQLRATVGILDPNWDPEHPEEYRCKPYSTEHRWYSLDYVEDTTKRKKTVAYHETTFPTDPTLDWIFGGEPMEDKDWGKGLNYHFYRDGVMQEDILMDLSDLIAQGLDAVFPQPYGTYMANLMVCDDIPFFSCDSAAYDEDTGFMWKQDGWGEELYINGHFVDLYNNRLEFREYKYRGMIGIAGKPYALLDVKDKVTLKRTGCLMPLTPDTTEIIPEGNEIEVQPTGGAFTDGRFGYLISGTELWRTDGANSECLIDLAPYGARDISVVRSVRALSDGRLLVSMDGKLIELSESDGSDTVTICDVGVLEYDAGLGDFDDFSFLVSKYNEQAEGSFARVKEYRDAGSLNLAILSGDMDMVVTSNQTALKNYIKQDILAPLEEVAPTLFEKDVLIESVVNSTCVDGICYYLPVNFDILGEYIADPSLLKDGTPLEDRVAYYDYIKKNDPEYFKIHTPFQILDNFAGDLDEWIDWENNTCHFDDGTFAPLLELCAMGCTEEQINDHFTEKMQIPLADWWSRDEKAGSFELEDAVESYRFTDLMKAQDYQKKLPKTDNRVGGPTTWVQVDFPMPSRVHDGYAIDAHNLYAIVDHEDTNAACGDFLRWLLLEDVVEEFPEKDVDDFRARGWDGFSINKEETDRYLKRLIDGYVDPEEEVAKINPDVAAKYPSTVADIRYWAQKYDARCGQTQYEITWEYINKADHLQYCDTELLRVIHNEANGSFTGSITAEKAADYIQNRISLYLAEQS